MVIIVINVTPNQLGIPYHAFHIGSALNQKIPFALYPVHLFLFERSLNTFLVKNINYAFEYQKKKTLLLLKP